MSFSESYDKCMSKKGLPLLGQIFSKRSFFEAIAILEEIHGALEAAGGAEMTFEQLALAAPALGLSEGALEVIAVLAGGIAQMAVAAYIFVALDCVGRAVGDSVKRAELDQLPEGFVQAELIARADGAAEPDEAVG